MPATAKFAWQLSLLRIPTLASLVARHDSRVQILRIGLQLKRKPVLIIKHPTQHKTDVVCSRQQSNVAAWPPYCQVQLTLRQCADGAGSNDAVLGA